MNFEETFKKTVRLKEKRNYFLYTSVQWTLSNNFAISENSKLGWIERHTNGTINGIGPCSLGLIRAPKWCIKCATSFFKFYYLEFQNLRLDDFLPPPPIVVFLAATSKLGSKWREICAVSYSTACYTKTAATYSVQLYLQTFTLIPTMNSITI